MVRFLHSADWQLGKQFANVADGDASAALRDERFAVIRRIADLARDRDVDAVLVAGDVFESNTVGDETLRRMIQAIRSFPGPWVLIPGNHDPALAASVWTRLGHIGVPDNLHLAVEPKPLSLADARLVVLPGVLRRRHEADDVTEWFDSTETPSGAVRVGLAHGSVTNRLPERAEAQNPIADDRAERGELSYLALGDWHGTLNIAERTWYAGTPEADRFGSSDPGNVLLVEIEAPGTQPVAEKLRVGRYDWATCDYVVTTPEDIPALDRMLEGLGDVPEDRLLWLKLSGVIDFATRRVLDENLENWRARLRLLRLDDEALVAEPTEDDLDRIDPGGFVRAAVETLRERTNDPTDSEREAARGALLRLYLEHIRQGG